MIWEILARSVPKQSPLFAGRILALLFDKHGYGSGLWLAMLSAQNASPDLVILPVYSDITKYSPHFCQEKSLPRPDSK